MRKIRRLDRADKGGSLFNRGRAAEIVHLPAPFEFGGFAHRMSLQAFEIETLVPAALRLAEEKTDELSIGS